MVILTSNSDAFDNMGLVFIGILAALVSCKMGKKWVSGYFGEAVGFVDLTHCKGLENIVIGGVYLRIF